MCADEVPVNSAMFFTMVHDPELLLPSIIDDVPLTVGSGITTETFNRRPVSCRESMFQAWIVTVRDNKTVGRYHSNQMVKLLFDVLD